MRTLHLSLGDELLPSVDVIGRSRKSRIRHDVYRQRGDVCGTHHTSNRQRTAKLIATVFELVSERVADNGVSTKPAAMRLTRIGASSSARAGSFGSAQTTQ